MTWMIVILLIQIIVPPVSMLAIMLGVTIYDKKREKKFEMELEKKSKYNY